MTYTTFVQIGRVVYINYGPNEGKLAVIVDILNESKVLIEGPTTGVDRELIPLKRIALTKFRIPIMRNVRTGTLKKAIEDFGLADKWAKTSLARKIALKTRRARLSDFDRFQVQLLRQKVARGVRRQVRVLRKAEKSKGGAKKGQQQGGKAQGSKPAEVKGGKPVEAKGKGKK